MIRFALFGLLSAIVVGAAFVGTTWLIIPAESPAESLATRFPEGWDTLPVVDYKRAEPWLSAVPELSADEFNAAVTAMEWRLRPPRLPQPADAVLTDAQIASVKDRLALTAEQEPYWVAVEAALRQVVWDRSQGGRRVEATSLLRFQEAAAPFAATLSARQRAEIQALANVVGMRLDLSAAQ
jgi:hypothetical protein